MTTLTAGSRLGTYEIVAPIGAGGMGEVYSARDTRLGRTVAVKVLRDLFAGDPERMARFEREAHLLAALSHPNIATIFGLEESGPIRALVMELIEGDTLADRLKAGALPVDDSLGIARQLADALEYAHERGIIHRDLKPANIKLTPDGVVKVLDFGLAKALDGTPAGSGIADSPTMSLAATQAGVILGTAAYMSPEQAKAKPADKRSDVWSFGCILFEMLTGRRAFEGEDVSDTLAMILRGEPDWSLLPADLTPQITMLVKRCLAKDRKLRIPDVSVARFLMTETIAAVPAPPAVAPPPPVAHKRTALYVSAALVAGIAVTAAVAWSIARFTPPPALQPMRFAIVPAPAQPMGGNVSDRNIAFSPDGSHVVYIAGTGASTQLMVRAIDRLDAEPISGITGVRTPFMSPDGRWIGYFAASELRKVSITGGPPISLCRVTGAPRGASWGSDDTIVFATADPSSGLWSVPAAGGDPRVLTKPDPAQKEADHLFPSVLPGGRAVLFSILTAGDASLTNSVVAVLDLATGQRKVLIRGGTDAAYMDSGHIVYAAAGSLRAVRFDPESLSVLSDPVPVVEQVQVSQAGAASYSISKTGGLAYVPGGAAAATARNSLVWVTRQGKELPIKIPPRAYIYPRLSPDGSRLALDIRDQENDIWIWDLARETLTRLTFDPGTDILPTWTPDGKRVVYSSSRGGTPNAWWQAADGTGVAEQLTNEVNPLYPFSISPDGTAILAREVNPKTGIDVTMLVVGPPGAGQGKAKVAPLIQTPFLDTNGEISPDGRWVAYMSNESGQDQVYVRPFPKVDGGRWQISPGGGTRPAWSKNGRELFYLSGNAMMAVPLQTTPGFSAGNPVKLFEGAYYAALEGRTYDVSHDGQRFIMIKESQGAAQTSTPASMVVVLNWVEELKARTK